MVLFLGGIMGEQYTIAERMKQLRNITGFNRAEFARQQGIPLRTIEEWEAGRRKMPEYVLRLLAYKIQLESSKKDQRIHIISQILLFSPIFIILQMKQPLLLRLPKS